MASQIAGTPPNLANLAEVLECLCCPVTFWVQHSQQ